MNISENVHTVSKIVPSSVTILAATKKRTVEEIQEALDAGVTAIGENYIQEAEKKHNSFVGKVEIHCIGHIQSNKAKKAAALFDVIQTIDSVKLAKELNKHCIALGKTMPVLIEVNSGREENKNGCMPEKVEELAKEIDSLSNLSLKGLMTMGPFSNSPEDLRQYYKETKKLFDTLKETYETITILSMGMSNSYQVAIEEGATMIRLGTTIFGERT